MHEFALAKNIIDIISEKIKLEEYSKITKVIIDIGRFASVDEDSLNFSFDAIKTGTILEHAILVFDHIPAKVNCKECSNVFVIENRYTPCPKCGSHRLNVISGNEFNIKNIEVE